MTRAILLIPCLLTGGTEVATLVTACALRELGYSVEIVVYFDEVDPAMLATFAVDGIVVRRLDLPRGAGLPSSLRLAWRLVRTFSGRRDLIWLQYMTPTLAPLLVARLFTQRLIACTHVAAGHYRSRDQRRLRWLARWWCDRFICVSQTSARGIFGAFDASPPWENRVAVLPNALDMGQVNSTQALDWRLYLGLPAAARIGGYVGRLAHNKGVDILIRAAATLRQDHPDLHWVIVGDGADRGPLETLASELGVSSVTHFVGVVTRPQALAAFKGFDVAVVPSREEGFGLSALEAMACSVPLVASRVDALVEVVVDGITGVLFEPGSAEDLVVVLSRVLSDASLRANLSLAGPEHARRHYDRPVYQQKLRELLAGFAST
jgi:glycosyltransferase involved in cell wall biosynthesis